MALPIRCHPKRASAFAFAATGLACRREAVHADGAVVYDPTEEEPPVLFFEGIPVLAPVHQASVLGKNLALAEWSGQLFLLRRQSGTGATAFRIARFEETAVREGRHISLPLHEGHCGDAFFQFTRFAADDHAEEVREEVLEKRAELVRVRRIAAGPSCEA